jgi:hypothetical protein
MTLTREYGPTTDIESRRFCFFGKMSSPSLIAYSKVVGFKVHNELFHQRSQGKNGGFVPQLGRLLTLRRGPLSMKAANELEPPDTGSANRTALRRPINVAPRASVTPVREANSL